MRYLPIKRIALCEKIAQTLQGVGYLQQRPLAIVAQTSKQLFGMGAEINDLSAIVQALPIFRPQHRATPGGDDCRRMAGQFVNHFRFKIAKTLLAVTLEKLTYGTAQALLNHLIRIEERLPKSPRQMTAYRRLTRTGQAHQNQAGHRTRSPMTQPKRFNAKCLGRISRGA